MRHLLTLLILCCIVELLFWCTGCTNTTWHYRDPSTGAEFSGSRQSLVYDLDGEAEVSTPDKLVRIKLKSNPNVEAMKAGIEIGKGLRP